MSKSRIEKREPRKERKANNNPQLLQLLSVAKGLHEACGLTVTGPFEFLAVPPFPPWAKNICEQLHLTIFKRFTELRPDEGPMKWRNFGRLVGVGFRELGFIQHDLQKQPDTSNHVTEQLPGLDELFASVLNGSHVDTLFDHYGRSLQSWVQIGLGQTPVEQCEFITGMAEGQTLVLDTMGQFVGDRGRTSVYLELLFRWGQIEEMRKARPAKTCADLYDLIGPSLGDPHLLHYQVFFRVCRDIGLSLTVRGRPVNTGENK